MNRYPVWKYLSIIVVLLLALLYTAPNFFGEQPAVQVSKVQVDSSVTLADQQKIEQALLAAKLTTRGINLENGSLTALFASPAEQIKGQAAIQAALNTEFVVAPNLKPLTPKWMMAIHAKPMLRGLDLRGGVRFLLEVDIKTADSKFFERSAAELKAILKDKKISATTVKSDFTHIDFTFADAASSQNALTSLRDKQPNLNYEIVAAHPEMLKVTASAPVLSVEHLRAIEQNIATLSKRIEGLGVQEATVKRAGADRIAVELPGVQDTAHAKDMIGRTAALEVRLVDEDNLSAALSGMEFEDSELLDYSGSKILVYKDLIITGENITSAAPNTDEKGQSIISLTLDSGGAERFRVATKENVGRRIAMILVEKDSKQVVTAPNVNEEIGGGQVQITGTRSLAEASQQAALLRAGALAAPMQIIEERTLAPSLGEENIKKGINATLYGFIAVFIFMMLYYRVFGITAALALGANLLLLVGVLSGLQATLTLPGIAAIALTLGMAIDSNVLINERIREELRDGASPQKAILAGYENAWRTILDSNVTTFIVGIMLLTFGTGPVKGFAIVHCVGILTSMFSAVLVSRALVNLSHGGRRLNKLWI